MGVDRRRDSLARADIDMGRSRRNMPAASRDPIAATSGISSPSESKCGSEKGTIRGVLAPVLDQYAVGFRVMHGFSSATSVHDVAEDDDGRDLIVALCRRL